MIAFFFLSLYIRSLALKQAAKTHCQLYKNLLQMFITNLARSDSKRPKCLIFRQNEREGKRGGGLVAFSSLFASYSSRVCRQFQVCVCMFGCACACLCVFVL